MEKENKASVFISKSKVPERKTIGESKSISRLMTQYGCIDFPYSPIFLNELLEMNSTHAFCLKLKASLTTKCGYSFTKLDNETDRKLVQDFFNRPNSNFGERFVTKILYKAMFDKFTYGRKTLEFERVGNKLAVYHVNAGTVYIVPKPNMTNVDFYVQLVTNNGKYIVNKFNKYDGKNYGSQILVDEDYFPLSGFYGIPSYITAGNSIISSFLAEKYNQDFFTNNATPGLLLAITGQYLQTNLKNEIKNQMNSVKGVGNGSKTVVVNLEDADAKIMVHQLSKGLDENFRNFRLDNRDEIAQIHSVPPKILGISSGGGMGGSESIGALKMLLETVIIPEQEELAEFVNDIISSEFGIDAGFTFKKLNLTNEKDLAVIHEIYRGIGAISNNEVRQEVGLQSIDGGDSYEPASKTTDKKVQTDSIYNRAINPNVDTEENK